jgi:thiamine pyrophosphokinase
MKNYIMFLHGRYKTTDLKFYKSFIKVKKTIAVDGGYSFFKKTALMPDVLLGDFDSIERTPENLKEKVEVISYPTEKDKSDSQLAIEYCIKNNAKTIDIVMPDMGEPDHFVGNLMLMTSNIVKRWVKNGGEIKIISRNYDFYFISYQRINIKNAQGSTLSIIPLSAKASLSCTGTKYDIRNLIIKKGESRSLRNIITSQSAMIKLDGEGIVIRKRS